MKAQSNSDTRFPGLWLRLARIALIAFAILLLGLLVVGVILFPNYAARHYPEFTPNAFWTGEQAQAALAELNWPPTALAWYLLIPDAIATLIGMSFALFLLWRKSDDWFGLYLTFTFLIVSPGSTLFKPVLELVPALVGMFDVIGATGWQLMFILFYVFPDGRFVPRWTRWMPLAWLGATLPSWLISYDVLQSPLGLWIGMGLVMTTIGSQVYRYGWRSTPLQRQQTKWVVAVLAGTFLFLIAMAPGIFKPPPENALGPTLQWALFGGALFRLSFLLIPAAMIIAILRYRLWDIDLLIRRTLQYSLLSGLLALVYFGLIIVLQSLFTAITGQQQNEFVTVLSTLAIAALFLPLRRRVQDFIDRRFYRKKYDAAKVIAEFAAICRDETDLEKLTARLVEVVQETMQPESVSLWLKSSPPSPLREAPPWGSRPFGSGGGG